MSEIQIPKIEKQDITAPDIQPGGTAIVMQRHERYERDRALDNAGSLIESDATAAKLRDTQFFNELLDTEDSAETMVLFISSDTQYAGRGRRSLETSQLAQDAAIEVLQEHGIDPATRIINFHPAFNTSRSGVTDQDIRPFGKLREPQIFDKPEYVDFLRDKYGAENGAGTGISQAAWAAHEADTEKEVREQMGAEGVHDIVDRTKASVQILERYAQAFHKSNPNKRLVIWAATHYDTLSPLVKDAVGAEFSDYLPVDYGAGVVINIEPDSNEVTLSAQGQKVALNLGHHSVQDVVAPPVDSLSGN